MKAVLALLLPVALAYLRTFDWIVRSWFFGDAYYAHGPLVVGVATVMVWGTRQRWLSMPAATDGRGWWLLGPGLSLHLAGSALLIDSLSAFSLALSLPGAVWLAAGYPRFRALLKILILLLFAIPMPLVVTGRVAFELKEIAVTSGLACANLFGLDAVRQGAQIHVPGVAEALLVADPCSGLRSLVALVTLGYGLAFFTGAQRGARRYVMLGAAAPIAIGTNVLRIAAICWFARWFGVEFAAGDGHDLLNGLVWVVDLAALLLLDAVWSRLASRRRRRDA